ncbi:hypothetical protein [Winogradskyella sp. 3972H.M.0a.05]|uniref:hypothetical protein n=1 Tax=Winogradskyella sp. 3972H.M.0a.05 TaxID=2950277 RepID=UPI003393C697
MKKVLFILSLFVTPIITSQNMTNEKLNEIFSSVSDTIQGQPGAWQLKIKDVTMISLTDSTNNRMRIISPIIEIERLDKDLMQAALVANFHTALDVKYAISDNILWSTFIHPLRELTEEQVQDAISQVYYANVNFGTTFASTSLVFPGNLSEDDEDDEKDKFEKRKF